MEENKNLETAQSQQSNIGAVSTRFIENVEDFIQFIYENFEPPKHLQETYANMHCNLLSEIDNIMNVKNEC